jgi:hypothetical protein
MNQTNNQIQSNIHNQIQSNINNQNQINMNINDSTNLGIYILSRLGRNKKFYDNLLEYKDNNKIFLEYGKLKNKLKKR